MTKDDLPPLPNPGIREWVGNEDKGETIEGFTHHQMREYACVARSDLLDALEFVVSAYEGSPSNERTMGFYEARNVARATIAKATGVQA